MRIERIDRVCGGSFYRMRARDGFVKKDHLSPNAIEHLVCDPQIDVVRSLLSNPTSVSKLTSDQVKTILDRNDAECLEEMARYHEYLEFDCGSLVEALSNHPEPSVRHALVEVPYRRRTSVPASLKLLAKKMLKDEDPAVRFSASEALGAGSL